jgi:hypothetical protein
MFEVMIVAGVVVLGVALLSYRHPLLARLAVLCILVATFLGVYFLSKSVVAGLVAVALWLFLPWIELLTRVRHIRLPSNRTLRRVPPPSREEFPDLQEITEDVEREGFEHVKDAAWEWEEFRQFFRLLYRADDRALAAICLSRQQEAVFSYVSIMSRGKDGRLWMTWNYPFTPHMKLPPNIRLNSQRKPLTFFDLYQNHLGFLMLNNVSTDAVDEQDEQKIDEGLTSDLQSQIAHNIEVGLLKRVNEEEVCYSWRGLFYIWIHFVLDFIRVR